MDLRSPLGPPGGYVTYETGSGIGGQGRTSNRGRVLPCQEALTSGWGVVNSDYFGGREASLMGRKTNQQALAERFVFWKESGRGRVPVAETLSRLKRLGRRVHCRWLVVLPACGCGRVLYRRLQHDGSRLRFRYGLHRRFARG